MLWLLASEYEGGSIPLDLDMLAFRLRTPKEKLTSSVKELIDKGFFESEQDASRVLAECLPREEKRRERVREEVEKESMSGKPDDAAEILDFLNARTGRSYKPVKANLEKIEARLKEGSTPEEIKQVVSRKCQEWMGTKMEQYLRPDTLFNATKFNQYVGQIGAPIRQFQEGSISRKQQEWDSTTAQFLSMVSGSGASQDDPYTIDMEDVR